VFIRVHLWLKALAQFAFIRGHQRFQYSGTRVMVDLLIRNGHLVLPDRVERADLAIENEKIVEIAPTISAAAQQEIDATGLHVFPGVIDPHVHFNEPGRADWEGFATGSSALAAGGGTMFFDMPLNSSPPVLDGKSFDLKLEAGKKNSFTDFALWGGLTPNNLDKMEELAERGVVGFKAFMAGSGIDDFARADDLTLFEGMQRAAKLGLPVAVHAESEEITSGLTQRVRAAGSRDVAGYLLSRPVIAEVEAVHRAMTLAQYAGCSLHIVHASCPAAVAAVAVRATRYHADVTCETCPHYLTLSAADLSALGAVAKCAPPLRSQAEQDQLWNWLTEGAISFVASDHSPSPPEMKASNDFFDVWGGIAGVQATLSILLTKRPEINRMLIAKLTATNVARRFEIAGKGRIAAGADADVAMIDLDASHRLERDRLLDRHKLSPYVGRTFHGLVRRTLVRGSTVFLDGKIVSEPLGRLVRPA